MQQTHVSFRRAWKRRALSLIMALTLILGLIPGFPSGESRQASAHWADTHLSQLVEWGFIRPDQANNPDRALTRADFMAIVNRAYGYHEIGETPFEDVAEPDWYYEDVGIAYTARYIKGTSPTTASPLSTLTRETAATILGRNMMLQESAGELLDFTDARRISSWAKGTIKSSLEHYLVSGYDDGTFRPQRAVSWGEMASMVTSLVGTPLQEAGDYALGGVYGNVTITSPGVTLRDTVVSGDLYISGGVGLGGVTLENVTVLGRIIASGTGQSEAGGSSILLRNVIADELLVDNLQDNYVSVRADGVTEIGRTTVRTSAYIEDNTPDGLGLKYISLEGETYPEGEEPEDWQPIALDLAGRIGEVVNKTPGSQVKAAAGTVAKLTVDEAAVDSTVVIDRGAVVKELNLDTGVNVTGQGDIEKLVVNAPGSTVEMLPDQIEIRPGITADINGVEMDNVAAQESTMEPLILAGYPQAQDVVPTGLDAVFSTNKAGTIYWAVSAITDGSIDEEALIKPPSYGNIAVRNGTVSVAKGNEEVVSKISGLTPGGSYYLSAILVDARGHRSPVKVISFTTPDNTTPAFCTGYPRMSKVSRTDSVVVVMPNKDCKLYYALLPQGAAAPTENELKTSSVAGALGYGVRDVYKNTEDAFRVNDMILDETTTYILYLWLTDADGVNKSKIVSLTFTTDDETPPEFIEPPFAEKPGPTNVGMKFQLSEAGTVYWVAFPSGSVKNYPKPQPGTDYESAPLNSEYAIQQVVNGMNIGPEGKSGRVTVKGNSDGAFIGTFNITGMKPETSYEVYYVAKDNAGPDRNYSVTVGHITISTQDKTGPVFVQSFELTAEGDKTRPRSNSSIYLDVSEVVYYDGQGGSRSLLELYQATQTGSAESRELAVNQLAEILYKSIVLHKYNIQSNAEETIYRKYQTGDTREDWTIDYTKAIVESRSEGGIRIIFPSEGLHLQNGGQYCFIINDLIDLSGNPIDPADGVNFWSNPTESAAPGHDVKPFVVDSPRVLLGSPKTGSDLPLIRSEDGTISEEPARMDMSFNMRPESTGSVSDDTAYDVLLWSGTRMAYDLYYRVVDGTTLKPIHTSNGGGGYEYPATAPTGDSNYLLSRAADRDSTVDKNGWIYLGNSNEMQPPSNQYTGLSISKDFNGCNNPGAFGQLNKLSENLEYQFVIMLTQHGSNKIYEQFEGTAKMKVNVAAGQAPDLNKMVNPLTATSWSEFKGDSIGAYRATAQDPFTDTQPLSCSFTLLTPPVFEGGNPEFLVNNDGTVSVNLTLSSSGKVHWAISEVDEETGMPKYDTTRYGVPGSDDYQYATPGDPNSAYEFAPDVTPVPNTTDQMYITANSHRPPQTGGTTISRPMPDWMIGGGGDTDVVNGENLITWPDNGTIISQEYGSDGRMRDWGIYTFTKGADTGAQGPLALDNVEPKKTYFAYFVTTAPEDYKIRSHVYIYQFTVPELKKPQIELSPDGNTGGMNVVLDMESQLEWRVFSAYDANDEELISILTQPFINYTDHNGKDTVDASGNVTAKGTNKLPEMYKNYTVMQALTYSYSFSDASKGDPNHKSNEYWYPTVGESYVAYDFEPGYSVFDMYANLDSKKQLIKLISTPALDYPEHLDSATAAASWSGKGQAKSGKNEAEFSQPLIDNTPYVFLSWAINWRTFNNGATADVKAPNASFRMTEFMKGSLSGPEVDNVPTGYLEYNEGDQTYSGRFTVHFDKPTYLLDGSQRVDMSPSNLFVGGSGQYADNPIGGGKFTAGTVTTQNVQFIFKGVTQGVIIEFLDRYFVNYNRLPALASLSASIEDYKGTMHLVVKWSNKSEPWRFPLSGSSSSGLTFAVSGKGIDGGTSNEPTLNLDSSSTTGQETTELTAAQTGGGDIKNLTYTWTVLDSAGQNEITSDVIELIDEGETDGSKFTIKGIRPGTAWVRVAASGMLNGSPVNKVKNIKITVTGKLEPFATSASANGVSWEDSTKTLTLTIDSTNTSPSAMFDVEATNPGAPAVSLTARAAVNVTGNAASYVDATYGSATQKLTVKPKGTIKEGYTGEATVTVSLVAAQDSTKSLTNAETFKVNISYPKTTTYNIPSNSSKVVPTGLSFSNVSGAKLNSGTLRLTGTALTSTIRAAITPSGASGTINWESSNSKVASVTPSSGSRVTITGLTAGSAIITAKVGNVTKSITVVVEPSISITSFTPNSPDKIKITQAADGTYTWTRPDGFGSCAAILEFTTGLSMDNAQVIVTSSTDSAVAAGNATTNGTSGRVQLTFGTRSVSEVTITIKVGTVVRKITIKLEGSDISSGKVNAVKR